MDYYVPYPCFVKKELNLRNNDLFLLGLFIGGSVEQGTINADHSRPAPSIRYNHQLVMSVCLHSHFPLLHRAANSDGV